MCLPSTFWGTGRRTVVIPMTSQFGCLELLITRTFLSGPVKFEITRVDCIILLILDCPGTESEAAGKASACQGCPNQTVCTSLPRGPDPGV